METYFPIVHNCPLLAQFAQYQESMRGRKAVHKLVTDRKSIGYVRVSTEEQAREGVSLAAQDARIRAFALATGRDIAEVVVDDGQSAKSLVRSGLEQILGAVRRADN